VPKSISVDSFLPVIDPSNVLDLHFLFLPSVFLGLEAVRKNPLLSITSIIIILMQEHKKTVVTLTRRSSFSCLSLQKIGAIVNQVSNAKGDQVRVILINFEYTMD